MQQLKRPVEQTDPPRSARETLPTMYDLPSEDPEEPGLPDVGDSPPRGVYHYLQPHHLIGGHYQELDLINRRIQIPEWKISLGVWQGVYEGIDRLWLRWFDAEGQLILSVEERAEQTEGQASQAEERANRLAERLRELGIDPNEV